MPVHGMCHEIDGDASLAYMCICIQTNNGGHAQVGQRRPPGCKSQGEERERKSLLEFDEITVAYHLHCVAARQA